MSVCVCGPTHSGSAVFLIFFQWFCFVLSGFWMIFDGFMVVFEWCEWFLDGVNGFWMV